MAIEDQILFTGKELNFEIPKMTELASAEQRLRDKVTKQEDLQLKYQEELRKNVNVPMDAFVSEFARKQQHEAVKAFQDKWTKIAKERGNKLTPDDLLDMQNDRANIAGLQNEWKSSETLWKQDQAMIQKSPGDFDSGKFAADTDAFLSTGQYKPNSLEYSGIDMADFFASENWSGSQYSNQEAIPGTDGFDEYTTVSGNATPEEGRKHILQTILSDSTGRALKGIIQDFSRLSPADKYEALKDYGIDKNGDKEISDQEMASANVKFSSRNILTNPLIQWAQKEYLPHVIKEKKTSATKRKPQPPASGVTLSQNVNAKGETSLTATQRGVSPEDAAAKLAEAAKPADAPVEDRTVAKLEGGIYTMPIVGRKDVEIDPKSPLPGLEKKVQRIAAKAYDPIKKTVTINAYAKNGYKDFIVTLADINTWPQEIKNEVLSRKIEMADGTVKTIGEAIGSPAPTSEKKDWSKYKQPAK